MQRGLLVTLLLAAIALAKEPDFSVEAMRERAEALRPDLEAALGAPLGGPVEIVASTPDALKDLLAGEFAVQRAEIAGGPRGEDLLKACRREAELISGFLLAKVEIEHGTIHICPDNFRRISGLDPAWKGILSQEALDTVLLHEMVHVFQVRQLGLKRFLEARPSIEELQARSAVIEGHAQHVGRAAATRHGLDAAFGLIDKAQTEVPASVEDPALRLLAEVVAAHLAFAYVDGEKFFRAVAGNLGYEKAVERVFSAPPATLRAVSRPEEYLAPPAADSSLDDFAARVQRLLAERGFTPTVIALPIPALRAAMMPAGPKTVEAAMRAFEKGVAVVGPGEPQVTVGILGGKDEEAGRVLFDADVATARAKDELFGKPGAQIRIVKADYRPFAADDGEGIEVAKTVQTMSAARQRVESVIVRRGALVLEVMFVGVGAARGQCASLAREALELLRGMDAADPWDGRKGDEARRALLGALDDPHWGVRWRATRNLARLRADAEIDAVLARMLRDTDTAVRCAAFRGLARRGWLGRAPASEQDALAAHADWEVRLAFLSAEREEDKEAQVARLLAALGDAHPAVRAYAFSKLDDLKAKIPWDRARAGIEDADENVRIEAIRTLGFRRLPPDSRQVLLKALRDENPHVRTAAAMRLDEWVTESQEVVEALVHALEDESALVRENAARGLKEAGKDAAAGIPALVKLLDDEIVRETAAETLGEIGVADPEAMRKLESLLEAGDLDFRFEVARALRRLGADEKPLVAVFAEALRKGDKWIRDEAAEELGGLGELARPHVEDLVAVLKDQEFRVRKAAADALGNLGAVAEEALPALDALGGKDEEYELKEDTDASIGLGGWDAGDVRRAAIEAARKIRAALAGR